MFSRRTFLAATAVLPAFAGKRIEMGLQIYSLRYNAEKNLPATLSLIRRLGFTEVEVPSLYGRSAAEFRRLLDDAGLKATSMMAEYDRLTTALDAVAADAHALGAEYVVCGTLPHKQKHLTLDECAASADQLNRWGETLAKSSLKLCYHTHGIEFDPAPGGTVFDALMKRCDPKFANFEMDIFWIVYGRQDPVKMLQQYPGRFPLMHVKDLKKDTPLGGSPGDVPEEASVPLGQGLVDIRATLRTAMKTGVLHYYIEDEVADAAKQIPESLKYLASLRL